MSDRQHPPQECHDIAVGVSQQSHTAFALGLRSPKGYKTFDSIHREPARMFVALLLAALPATTEPAGALGPLSACRKLADPQPRLACYDAAVRQLDDAQAKGSVVVVDRKQLHALHRKSFGLGAVDVGAMLGAGPHDAGGAEDDMRLVAKLKSVHTTASGRYVLLTEDDQQWRQADDREVPSVQGGTTLTVHRAGSRLLCAVDGGGEFRCSRDR